MSEGTGSGIQITKVTVGPYGENCYLLTDPATKESIIVDPGDEIDKIMATAAGTRVTKIVITHRHGDHTGALAQARTATAAPVAAHPADAADIPGGAEIKLEDGETITLGRLILRVLHTPGHTPGGICLLSGNDLIAGDTLFPGGPGRTATPGAFEQIVKSIQEKIYTLPEATMIYPGHGENTTVGASKKEYDSFAGKKRGELPYGDVLWASS